MDRLYLHPSSRRSVASYLKNPTHGLLLSGEKGVGLGTIARTMATDGMHALVHEVSPDEKGTIGIEQVHDLYTQTRSKRQTSQQVVLIDDAEAMSQAAQNALLKLLEEPVEGVFFILTTHSPEKLLETIRSRVGHIRLNRLAKEQTQMVVDAFAPGIDTHKRQQLIFIAPGLPAELYRLVNDDEHFNAAAELVRDARVMLSSDMYEKVRVAYKYDKSRERAMNLLEMVSKLLKFTIFTNADLAAPDYSTQLEAAAHALEYNGHVRTHLLRLATT